MPMRMSGRSTGNRISFSKWCRCQVGLTALIHQSLKRFQGLAWFHILQRTTMDLSFPTCAQMVFQQANNELIPRSASTLLQWATSYNRHRWYLSRLEIGNNSVLPNHDTIVHIGLWRWDVTWSEVALLFRTKVMRHGRVVLRGIRLVKVRDADPIQIRCWNGCTLPTAFGWDKRRSVWAKQPEQWRLRAALINLNYASTASTRTEWFLSHILFNSVLFKHIWPIYACMNI